MSAPSDTRSRHLPAGAVIFRQGDPGEEMFVISAGRVSLRLGSEGHEREIAVLGPGEFFGEMSLLGTRPRTATAVATADTALLPVRRETFGLMMQDDLEVVFRMLDVLGRRLGETDRHVEELAGRLGRLRAAGHALGKCLAASDGAVAFDAPALARAAEVSVSDAEAVMGELAGRGIGRLDGGRWCLEPGADARRLADALAAG